MSGSLSYDDRLLDFRLLLDTMQVAQDLADRYDRIYWVVTCSAIGDGLRPQAVDRPCPACRVICQVSPRGGS